MLLKTIKVFLITSFVGYSFILAGYFAFAQQNLNSDFSNQITNLENELLAPSVELDLSSSGRLGQIASISALTDNINDSTVSFLWYLDDVFDQKQSGKSKTKFSFKTTRANHVVRLVIMQRKVKITENAILVSSYNVSLAWNAETYVPPEYEGKALPSRGSKVTVTAIPDIKGYDSKDLLYTWYLDAESRVRKVLGEDEFSFFITKSVDFIPVFVEVSNLSGSIVVSQAVSIPVVRPSVLIYHQLSDKTAKTAVRKLFIAPGESKKITAKPFNFQAKSIIDFEYEWEFIGKKASGERKNPNLLTLIIPETSSLGIKNLMLKVINRKFIKERTSAILVVNITK